jgi:hypothetical protein
MAIFSCPEINAAKALPLEQNFLYGLGNGQVARTHEGKEALLILLKYRHFPKGANLVNPGVGSCIC